MKHYTNDKHKSFNRNERARLQFRAYHHNVRGGYDYDHHKWYQSDEIANIDAAVEKTWPYVLEYRQVIKNLLEEHGEVVLGGLIISQKNKYDRITKQVLRECLVRCMDELEEDLYRPNRGGHIKRPIKEVCVSLFCVILSFSFSI